MAKRIPRPDLRRPVLDGIPGGLFRPLPLFVLPPPLPFIQQVFLRQVQEHVPPVDVGIKCGFADVGFKLQADRLDVGQHRARGIVVVYDLPLDEIGESVILAQFDFRPLRP